MRERIDCTHYAVCIVMKRLYDKDFNCDGCNNFDSILFPKLKDGKVVIKTPPYLESCPFCGGEAEIKRGTACMGHGDYGPEKWIQCKKCGARTQAYICDGYYGCEMTDDELAEKWNTRV